ncbi:MAG TPA: hypothetical protein VD767_01785 [Thermomicrobiales bacterium]|nr:hypothetical protein [Thermomicrobiales bacterium]
MLSGDGPSTAVAVEFEVARSREAEGLNLYLRVVGGDWHFRVAPIRDPSQARFWCLVLEPCAEPSVNAQSTPYPPFLACPGLTRDRMLALLAEIRQEPMVWIRDPGNRAMMEWLRAIAGMPVPVRPQPIRPARPVAPKVEDDLPAQSSPHKRSVIP